MKNFDEIIANIQKELLELKEINLSLREENTSLRKQLGMLASNDNDELSLEDAFDHFEVKNDTGNMKKRAYNTLMRAGYGSYGRKDIMQFEGMSAYELLAIRNMGNNLLAIIIVMLEHFGVSIEIPDTDCDTNMSYYRRLREIRNHNVTAMIRLKKLIDEYRDRITFS